jgi:hypothetical protein
MPGNAHTVAVSRRYANVSRSTRALRSTTTASPGPCLATHLGSNRIEFGDDPARLYGLCNEGGGLEFRRLRIDATGVDEVDRDVGPDRGFGADMIFDRGVMYGTTAAPSFPRPASSRYVSGDPERDGGARRNARSGRSSCRGTRFAFRPEYVRPEANRAHSGGLGTPASLVRWGTDGLAFRTSWVSSSSYGRGWHRRRWRRVRTRSTIARSRRTRPGDSMARVSGMLRPRRRRPCRPTALPSRHLIGAKGTFSAQDAFRCVYGLTIGCGTQDHRPNVRVPSHGLRHVGWGDVRCETRDHWRALASRESRPRATFALR